MRTPHLAVFPPPRCEVGMSSRCGASRIAEMAEEDVFGLCDFGRILRAAIRLCRASRRRRACLLQKDRRHRGRHAGGPFPMGRECGAGAGPRPAAPSHTHDYIATLIAWAPGHRSRHVAATSKTFHGRHWAAAIAARRHFPQSAILYGPLRRRSAGRTGTCAHGGTPLQRSCGMVRRPSDEEILGIPRRPEAVSGRRRNYQSFHSTWEPITSFRSSYWVQARVCKAQHRPLPQIVHHGLFGTTSLYEP